MGNEWSLPTAAEAPQGDPETLRALAGTLTQAGTTVSDAQHGVDWIMASMTDWKGTAQQQCAGAVTTISATLGGIGNSYASVAAALTTYASVLEQAQSQWNQALDNYRPYTQEILYNPSDTYSNFEFHADGSVWSSTVWASVAAYDAHFAVCSSVTTGRPVSTEEVSPGWKAMFDTASASVQAGKNALLSALSADTGPLQAHAKTLNGTVFGSPSYSVPISGNPALDSYLPWAATAGTLQVQPGDNLWDIAQSLYGNGEDYTKLVAANPQLHGDPNTIIQPGELLTYPTTGVVASTGLTTAAVASPLVSGMIAQAAAETPPAPPPPPVPVTAATTTSTVSRTEEEELIRDHDADPPAPTDPAAPVDGPPAPVEGPPAPVETFPNLTPDAVTPGLNFPFTNPFLKPTGPPLSPDPLLDPYLTPTVPVQVDGPTTAPGS